MRALYALLSVDFADVPLWQLRQGSRFDAMWRRPGSAEESESGDGGRGSSSPQTELQKCSSAVVSPVWPNATGSLGALRAQLLAFCPVNMSRCKITQVVESQFTGMQRTVRFASSDPPGLAVRSQPGSQRASANVTVDDSRPLGTYVIAFRSLRSDVEQSSWTAIGLIYGGSRTSGLRTHPKVFLKPFRA
ncbi:hypothetical protein FKP32DRAFT_682202 [Trametes sanguinea]|nr:hypothetical protein FKP32DRAFT_682202 [Trametes sanguinea]